MATVWTGDPARGPRRVEDQVRARSGSTCRTRPSRASRSAATSSPASAASSRRDARPVPRDEVGRDLHGHAADEPVRAVDDRAATAGRSSPRARSRSRRTRRSGSASRSWRRPCATSYDLSLGADRRPDLRSLVGSVVSLFRGGSRPTASASGSCWSSGSAACGGALLLAAAGAQLLGALRLPASRGSRRRERSVGERPRRPALVPARRSAGLRSGSGRRRSRSAASWSRSLCRRSCTPAASRGLRRARPRLPRCAP